MQSAARQSSALDEVNVLTWPRAIGSIADLYMALQILPHVAVLQFIHMQLSTFAKGAAPLHTYVHVNALIPHSMHAWYHPALATFVRRAARCLTLDHHPRPVVPFPVGKVTMCPDGAE
jgi:hypothetical protein